MAKCSNRGTVDRKLGHTRRCNSKWTLQKKFPEFFMGKLLLPFSLHKNINHTGRGQFVPRRVVSELKDLSVVSRRALCGQLLVVVTTNSFPGSQRYAQFRRPRWSRQTDKLVASAHSALNLWTFPHHLCWRQRCGMTSAFLRRKTKRT